MKDEIDILESTLEGTIVAIERLSALIVHLAERVETLERISIYLSDRVKVLERHSAPALRLVVPEPAEAIPADVATDRGGLEKGS